MHQARAMQTRESTLYVQTIAEHKLAHRPGTLFAGMDQEAVDTGVRYAQDIADSLLAIGPGAELIRLNGEYGESLRGEIA